MFRRLRATDNILKGCFLLKLVHDQNTSQIPSQQCIPFCIFFYFLSMFYFCLILFVFFILLLFFFSPFDCLFFFILFTLPPPSHFPPFLFFTLNNNTFLCICIYISSVHCHLIDWKELYPVLVIVGSTLHSRNTFYKNLNTYTETYS